MGVLRVTHAVFDFDGGGLETLVGAMARHYHGTAVQMSVVTLGGRHGRAGAAAQPFLQQYHVLRPLPGLSIVAPLGVARAIRATRPHVLHLHSGAWLKPAWAARLARVPHVVYTEHGREHSESRAAVFLDRQAARLTDVVVTVSERLQAYMTRILHLDPARVRTITNGVDTERFVPGIAPASLCERLGIPPGALVIGSVGRLESVKAYHRLIDAVRIVRAALDRPVVLVICGDGSLRADLERRVAAAGLAGAAWLPGWADAPVEWYRLFDMFALSSDSEGLSVSLLEAMACGRAPVVTDVGANAQVLGPELGAQVVPAGSTEALAEALLRTARDDAGRVAMGVIARRRVTDGYSLARMAGEYERLYRELAGPGPSA